jgi:hypothetical protein
MNAPVLETKWLRLRPLRTDDADALHAETLCDRLSVRWSRATRP